MYEGFDEVVFEEFDEAVRGLTKPCLRDKVVFERFDEVVFEKIVRGCLRRISAADLLILS